MHKPRGKKVSIQLVHESVEFMNYFNTLVWTFLLLCEHLDAEFEWSSMCL